MPRAPDAYDIEIARRIRALRVARNMTQPEVADRLGVTYQQVQKYEVGSNRLGAGRLRRMAEILDVPVAALFGVGEDKGSGADPLPFLTTAGAARLLEAYSRVGNRAMQLALVRLVRGIAERGERRQGRGQR